MYLDYVYIIVILQNIIQPHNTTTIKKRNNRELTKKVKEKVREGRLSHNNNCKNSVIVGGNYETLAEQNGLLRLLRVELPLIYK